jgi:hypothetical protein
MEKDKGYRLYNIKPVVVLAVALVIFFASFLPSGIYIPI